MEIDILSKAFGSKQVLGAISLNIGKGEIIALTGPSGIGKSTLVRILSGLDHHYDGRVNNVGRVGFVFQEPTLLPWRNLLENITIVTNCTPQSAKSALTQVELGGRLDAYPNQLSLGQQRRVALARALAATPQTLILDEAFASLDEATASRMRTLALRVITGGNFSTILVTHSLKEAAEMADRILVLDGSPARIVLDHHITTPPATRDCPAEIAILRTRLGNISPS